MAESITIVVLISAMAILSTLVAGIPLREGMDPLPSSPVEESRAHRLDDPLPSRPASAFSYEVASDPGEASGLPIEIVIREDSNSSATTLLTENKPVPEECSETPDSGSSYTLICPSAFSFNISLRKERNLTVSIESVNGPLHLPSDSGGPLLLALKASAANVTSINTHTEQKQVIKSLEKLELNHNPDLDAQSLVNLGELPSLKELYLRGSALKSLEGQLPALLKNLPKLQRLVIASTGIQYLRESSLFTSNKELTYLDLADNELSSITLNEEVINRLHHLNLSGCALRSIQIQGHAEHGGEQGHLQNLDVSHNRLKDLPQQLIQALAKCDVTVNILANEFENASSNCPTYFLDEHRRKLPKNTSECPSNLIGNESISFNQKEALANCDWSICPTGCQCDQKNKIVDCRNKGLQRIPLIAPSEAETLLLQNNSITTLDGLGSPVWCNLKRIRVNDNKLVSLLHPEAKGSCMCHSGESFYSEIHRRDHCFPQSLRELYLNQNNIGSLSRKDCSLLYPLNVLDLAQNKMTEAVNQECGHLENLEVLDLSHNAIRDISEPEFATYPNLREFWLSYNDIKHIKADVMAIISRLEILDLRHNQIVDIVGDLWAPKNALHLEDRGHLRELYLDNNKLSLVEYFKNLTKIPTLKKVSLFNNPWACDCNEMNQLWDNIFRPLNNAVFNALENMTCATPLNKEGTPVKDHLKTCPEPDTAARDNVFMTVMGGFVIVTVCIFICHSQKTCKKFRERLGEVLMGKSRMLCRRNKKHDCFIVCSSRDLDVVRQRIITPLSMRGYNIAWHDNVFRPGDYIIHNIERAVKNSSRMLVFASPNLLSSRWGRQEVRRGLHEEFTCHDGFKVMALVSEDLPRFLNRDVYDIVALRTHVKLTDRDYIQQICDFLPPVSPSNTERSYFTEDDFATFVRAFNEIKAMDRQQNNLTSLTHLFHTSNDNNRITINVAVERPWSSHSCQNDSGSCEHCKKECDDIIERYKPMSMPTPPANLDSQSVNDYVLTEDSCEDITDVLQEDGFVRKVSTRGSCRF